MQSGQELVEACCRGERGAAEELVRGYQSAVYTLAMRMLGDTQEAEDAAQTVFLNALRSLHLFRGASSLKTWLYRIAVNECSARAKLKKRFPRPATDGTEDPVAELPDPNRLASDSANEEEQETRNAVAALPESYRLPIILRYFGDLSYEETAQALGVTVETVKIRLFRAKAMLRTILSEREDSRS